MTSIHFPLQTAGSLDELAKGTEAAILQNKTLRADIRRLVEDSCRAVKLPADVLHRSEEDIAKEIEKRCTRNSKDVGPGSKTLTSRTEVAGMPERR